MPKVAFLVLPTQLFADIKAIKAISPDIIYVYEEPKFFTKYEYHKQKLILHRASCKWYAKWLGSKMSINIEYVDYDSSSMPVPTHMYDPFDHELRRKYAGATYIDGPGFLLTKGDIETNASIFFNGSRFNHAQFYKWQRKRLDVLMKGNKPLGGKWSYDAANRKKLSIEDVKPSARMDSIGTNTSVYVKEAIQYVEDRFPNAPGTKQSRFIWPINHQGSRKWLDRFIRERLSKFGPFQDASIEGESVLYHSALSPMLNIGLITDMEVLDAIISTRAPLASKEGFIRQLIGWRNYMLAIYIIKGEELPNMNHWSHDKKMGREWWTGDTDIYPVNDVIKRALDYGFVHHIERLMYLGVWMFLTESRPSDVYKWFMEMTVDAYEWVMVPNVFGMSQNADGSTVMKRLYICGSNYILKMSNYKKGVWVDIWDEHYRKFIKKEGPKLGYYYASQVSKLTK